MDHNYSAREFQRWNLRYLLCCTVGHKSRDPLLPIRNTWKCVRTSVPLDVLNQVVYTDLENLEKSGTCFWKSQGIL